MDELKNEIAILKVTVNEMKEVNESLKCEVLALKSEVSSTSQTTQEQQQQLTPLLTPIMPNIYTDIRYLSTDERKQIKFEMSSNLLTCLRFDDKNPARFHSFTRDGEEEIKKPEKFNGLTVMPQGTFISPIGGKYRLDIKGRMEGEYGAKAEWYICYASKDDDININDDEDCDSDDSDYKEKMKEKERIFNEKTTRKLLFTFELEGCYGGQFRQGHVGIECDKGISFWTEVVVLEGKFSQRECAITFGGRLIC